MRVEEDFLGYGSVRLYNVCAGGKITTIEELAVYTEAEFLKLKNCGRKTLRLAKSILQEQGLVFARPKNAGYVPPEVGMLDKEMLAMFLCGVTYKEIGERFKHSSQYVHMRVKISARIFRLNFKDLQSFLSARPTAPQLRQEASLILSKMFDFEV